MEYRTIKTLVRFSAENKLMIKIRLFVSDTNRALNMLLRKNYALLRAYKNVAESIDCLELHQFFNQKVNERYVFGHQIKTEIKQLNGFLFDKDQFKGSKISKWPDLKYSTDHVTTLLKACEQREENCLNEYFEYLASLKLPKSTRTLLQLHYNQISSTLWNLQFKILKYQIDDFTSSLISQNAVLSF